MGAVKFDMSCSLGAVKVGWSQWDLALSQCNWFCWLVGWLSPACAGDWQVLFTEASCALSNSQEKICIPLSWLWSFLQNLQRGCFFEPCTENPLLFSILLSYQCLEPFGWVYSRTSWFMAEGRSVAIGMWRKYICKRILIIMNVYKPI